MFIDSDDFTMVKWFMWNTLLIINYSRSFQTFSFYFLLENSGNSVVLRTSVRTIKYYCKIGQDKTVLSSTVPYKGKESSKCWSWSGDIRFLSLSVESSGWHIGAPSRPVKDRVLPSHSSPRRRTEKKYTDDLLRGHSSEDDSVFSL